VKARPGVGAMRSDETLGTNNDVNMEGGESITLEVATKE
jgi:hypothetical protein